MLREGRTTTAILWLRRAIADGDPDARLDLAKILLSHPSHGTGAIQLLEAYVAAGPQEIYALRPIGEFPRVNESVRIEDEDFEEAKLILKGLKGSISA
jgi:hypothetical protein